MKKIKVKLTGKGTFEEPYTVLLPTWIMAEKSPNYINKTAEIWIPDDEINLNGKLKQTHIRIKYKENWSNFNASSVEV